MKNAHVVCTRWELSKMDHAFICYSIRIIFLLITYVYIFNALVK